MTPAVNKLTPGSLDGGESRLAGVTALRELAVFAAAVCLALAIVLAAGGAILWTHPLWTDEVIMSFLVSDPSPLRMVRAVARGGDWNPPLLHVLAWPIVQVAGAPTPVLARSLSVACVVVALAFVYLAMRRVVGRAASAAGALAVAGHPLVIGHAFEGRFYGPWLLFAAALAWSLSIDPGRPKSRRRDLAVAASAVLLCTNHWYGVFSLGLMSIAAVLARTPDWRAALRLVAPAAAGLIALGLLSPVALAQRAAAEGLQWIAPLNRVQVEAQARLYWAAIPVVLAGVALAVATVAQRTVWTRATPWRRAAADPGLAALTALALMPLVLVGLSLVLQPSMHARYALAAALAWAPVVALAVESLRPAVRVGALVYVSALLWTAGGRVIGERREFAATVTADSTSFAQAAALEVPVVFVRLHSIYPVAGPRREATRARFLAIPDSAVRALYPAEGLEWFRRSLRVDRDIARLHDRLFGFPRVATQADLDTTERFALVASDANLPAGYRQLDAWARAVFPAHRVTRLSGSLSLFERPRRSSDRGSPTAR